MGTTLTVRAQGQPQTDWTSYAEWCPFVVWNGSSNKTLRLVKLEVEYCWNDTTIAGVVGSGCTGYIYQRCTDGPPTGGISLTPEKMDTSSADLPAQVVIQAGPTGGPVREAANTLLASRGVLGGVDVRSLSNWFGQLPQVNMLEDRHWRPGSGSQVQLLHLEPGQGLCVYHSPAGPQGSAFEVVLRNPASGACYHLLSVDACYMVRSNGPTLCIWNGAGSGIDLDIASIAVVPVSFNGPPPAHNATLHRIGIEPIDGQDADVIYHDPSSTLSGVYAKRNCYVNSIMEENLWRAEQAGTISTGYFALGYQYPMGRYCEDEMLLNMQLMPYANFNQVMGLSQRIYEDRIGEGIQINPGQGLAVRFPSPTTMISVYAWYSYTTTPEGALVQSCYPFWSWLSMCEFTAEFATGTDIPPIGGGGNTYSRGRVVNV